MNERVPAPDELKTVTGHSESPFFYKWLKKPTSEEASWFNSCSLNESVCMRMSPVAVNSASGVGRRGGRVHQKEEWTNRRFLYETISALKKHVLRLDKLNNQTTKEGSERGL